MSLPYLIQLAESLQTGLRKYPPERWEKHRSFLLAQQCEDGGFRGREGDSDLYYTGFAVRALSLIGELDEELLARLGTYLRQEQQRTYSPVDVLNWISCAVAVQLAGGEDVLSESSAAEWLDRVFADLNSLRREDGGFAKGPEGKLGSTYQTFLVVMTHNLLGRTIESPERIVDFMFDRQRDDGGFVEIAPMRRSGTNPTAAAVATLKLFGAVDAALIADVRDYLKDVEQDDGGVAANTRIPFGDVLSTFTALVTKRDLGIELGGLQFTAQDFVKQGLEFPTGGFRAALWDDQADVEYTYYALGVLGLTASNAQDD
ncbi:prenyltransferase/squalene oxidase repeat-containing protein [Rubinisphaera italica]|uniref:Prenyltransferase and squalene oxidase repeat protein n=1 Tax=Rubinisphaera italica TaxID=2527969 RepID=A0A5C5XBP7_9PLAN|nr:prenyltransferase/squalene oxidase repeat-containing protein [Rubinisphaera italica]TWT60184.1 Prenyltransferase and squalene oxidase repeat protein [Rubinisphaera italica]